MKEESSATLYQYYTASFYTMKRELKGDTVAQANMRAQMLTDYLALTDYVQAGLARPRSRQGPRLQALRESEGNIETVFVAIADCADMVPVLDAAVADPDNMDLKLKVLRLLNKKECTDNDLFLPVATAVYSVEPSAPAAYAIGIGFAKANNSTRAAYMEDAVNRCGDCTGDLPLEDGPNRQRHGPHKHRPQLRTSGVGRRC